jgi:hypothetical protein
MIDFPASPIIGQQTTLANGVTYQWNGTIWVAVGAAPYLGFRRLGRVVPTAGQATIDFTNIPADINDLELRYDATPSVNGGYLYLQTYGAAGSVQTTASYIYFSDYVSHVSPQGGNVTAYNGSGVTVIPLNLNTAGWGVSSTYSIQGIIKVNNIRDGTRDHYFQHDCIMIEQTNTYWALLKGGGIQTARDMITGLRLYWSTGGFAARGAVTLWGSP